MQLLLVDNDLAVAQSLKSIIENGEHHCKICQNPELVIDLLKKDTYHLVITDLKMPELSGIELIERIKRYDPDIPVILLTAYIELIDEAEAEQLGAYTVFYKPPNIKELMATLEEIPVHN